MNRNSAPSHVISGVFVFLLLGIFAVFSTVMVLLGVKAYRSAVERTGMHNTARINTAYIRTMLRADDETGTFAVEEVTGTAMENGTVTDVSVETLTLRNNYDGEEYITRIYVYGGSLREWFTRAEEPFRADGGEVVCPAEELTAELDENLLTVRVRAGEEWSTVYLALRAGT
ncbi:MAG: DUF4860 domain-containing protein [Oscillospiraceae bacterium]|nr:DUF4860 domain-containing protein [Oscillospiraceae bacterium]MBR0392868.1 DUF4860 domain-containing protein [Oscillospiraceae bacterium]